MKNYTAVASEWHVRKSEGSYIPVRNALLLLFLLFIVAVPKLPVRIWAYG